MLRDLFRQKLEKAEVHSSPSFEAEFFRKLGRKEFLRFDPLRFNAWYAGVIITAAALGLIFYLNGSSDNEADAVLPESGRPAAGLIRETEESLPPRINPWETEQEGKDISEDSAVEEPPGSQRYGRLGSDVDGGQAPLIPPGTEIKNAINGQNIFQKTDGGSERLRSPLQHSDLIMVSQERGCSPLKVSFRARSGDFNRYRWTFGDGGVSEEAGPDWIFDMEGEYTVTLHAYKSDELQAVGSRVIRVFPRPLARFEIIPENGELSENRIRLINYSVNAVRFTWDFGDGHISGLYEPVHVYREGRDHSVKLTAFSEEGCTDTIIVSRLPDKPENYIEFPNAFLPGQNGPTGGFYSASSDDAATVFHPVSSGVTNYQLKIFSKLGLLIFESNDINIGWDGYYKGRLCQAGVYIWKVRGTYINGETFTRMGDLTLLKNTDRM